MREIIACFPVYRTYVNEREPEVTARDRDYIERAVREARRRNPNRPAPVYHFVRDLLLKNVDCIPESDREQHLRFVGKFQQVTSPVTAKGIEDTALYIYNRLVSLNEVGGEPDHFGVAPEDLHAWLAARARRWPHGLSTTSTHDTKRSEDVRARLNVLSEIPGAWKQATARWARANRRGRTIIDGESYPSRNEEYLLYQTLVGSWPLEPMDDGQEGEYRARIVSYVHKAMREAKVFTSWLNPSDQHEAAMARFVEAALAPDNATFRDDFVPFASRVAQYGIYNSLSQVAIKIAAPGVPDFYQGTELWDFSLVDPDNRRQVDYARRGDLLTRLDADCARQGRGALAAAMLEEPRADRLKLYATSTLLRFRQKEREIFEQGGYRPLTVTGVRREHVFAFARELGDRQVVTVVPRLVATLLGDAEGPPVGETMWGDTRVELAAARRPFRHVLTDECIRTDATDAGPGVRVAAVLNHFPIGVMVSTPDAA
jgi:(1->4)-alpha-D-glucan 1-alpha-D-glucosylmutase